MPQGTTASGGLMNSDVSYFTPTNELDQSNKEKNTGPLAGAFVRNAETFKKKLEAAGGKLENGNYVFDEDSNGNQRKFNRINTRFQNYKANQEHRSKKNAGGTDVGNFIRNNIVRSKNSIRSGGSGTKVGNALRGIASIFKKKP